MYFLLFARSTESENGGMYLLALDDDVRPLWERNVPTTELAPELPDPGPDSFPHRVTPRAAVATPDGGSVIVIGVDPPTELASAPNITLIIATKEKARTLRLKTRSRTTQCEAMMVARLFL